MNGRLPEDVVKPLSEARALAWLWPQPLVRGLEAALLSKGLELGTPATLFNNLYGKEVKKEQICCMYRS